MKPVKFIILPLLLLSMSFSCFKEKEEEDYNAITYYDAVGEGYVFMYDTAGNILYPVTVAKILVTTFAVGGGLFSLLMEEVLTPDERGKYFVRFVKRTKRRDAGTYRIYILNDIGIYVGASEFTISSDEIKNAKHTILLDTIKVRK
jgi:hypothetical protein